MKTSELKRKLREIDPETKIVNFGGKDDSIRATQGTLNTTVLLANFIAVTFSLNKETITVTTCQPSTNY